MAGIPGKGGKSREETGLDGSEDRRGRAHSRLDEASVSDGLIQATLNGWGAPALARYLGISTPTATQILSGKTWQHVPRPAALAKQQAARSTRLSVAAIEEGLQVARASGWGAHKLARYLNVSPATATRYLAERALPAPPPPPPPPPPVRAAPVVVLPRLPRIPVPMFRPGLSEALGTDLDTAVADRFNVSPSRVQQLREAAGIPAFVAVRREAIRAVAGSKSDAALAAELGVDRKTIRKHRREAGIANDYNEAVANRDATIRALIDANPGASLRAIAAEAGVNASTVMRVRRAMETGG